MIQWNNSTTTTTTSTTSTTSTTAATTSAATPPPTTTTSAATSTPPQSCCSRTSSHMSELQLPPAVLPVLTKLRSTRLQQLLHRGQNQPIHCKVDIETILFDMWCSMVQQTLATHTTSSTTTTSSVTSSPSIPSGRLYSLLSDLQLWKLSHRRSPERDMLESLCDRVDQWKGGVTELANAKQLQRQQWQQRHRSGADGGV